MKEGAMGLGSSLIYAPADFATTGELIGLSKVAASHGGMYITHMRSEGDKIYSALHETFRIAQEAGIHAEIYHLKVTQKWNWNKVDTILTKIDSARQAGLNITANMYTYHASGTGLVARMPTWVQDGGPAAMRKRLLNPAIRQRVLRELELGIPSRNSAPADVMILGFRLDSLNKLYQGKRLDEIARHHGKSGDETAIDLLIADKSSIPSIFFLMSEDNVKKMLRQPYVSIGSDAASKAAEKPFTDGGTHPRVYGTFARFLGKYVREEKLMTMEEGVRRITSLPATNLKIRKRGSLQVGYFADLAIFDAATFIDHATFEKPHQYATGMVHVFVNGVQVLNGGEHTGTFPGRAVRGPGFR
jgi:N-acyl-D-amino-acid deacylase